MISPTGTYDLGGRDPEPLVNIRSTFDVALQSATQDAVDLIEAPAAIVAIEPSSGGVPAVSQNEAANERGPIALTGLYPPGPLSTR